MFGRLCSLLQKSNVFTLTGFQHLLALNPHQAHRVANRIATFCCIVPNRLVFCCGLIGQTTSIVNEIKTVKLRETKFETSKVKTTH